MRGVVLNMDKEVQLYTMNAERETCEMSATPYGIIIGLDYLKSVKDSWWGCTSNQSNTQ